MTTCSATLAPRSFVASFSPVRRVEPVWSRPPDATADTSRASKVSAGAHAPARLGQLDTPDTYDGHHDARLHATRSTGHDPTLPRSTATKPRPPDLERSPRAPPARTATANGGPDRLRGPSQPPHLTVHNMTVHACRDPDIKTATRRPPTTLRSDSPDMAITTDSAVGHAESERHLLLASVIVESDSTLVGCQSDLGVLGVTAPSCLASCLRCSMRATALTPLFFRGLLGLVWVGSWLADGFWPVLMGVS